MKRRIEAVAAVLEVIAASPIPSADRSGPDAPTEIAARPPYRSVIA